MFFDPRPKWARSFQRDCLNFSPWRCLSPLTWYFTVDGNLMGTSFLIVVEGYQIIL